jgi:hypothetical protein
MESDIQRKIRGLLKKAEATAFEEEADAFLRKAQELMYRHGIDEERLWAADPSRRHKIEVRKIKILDGKAGSMHRRIILSEIARVNHCKMWYSPGSDLSSVAGYPNDLLFVEMLFTSIKTQMSFKEAIALAHSVGVHPKTFRSNFAEAYTGRICDRLAENYRLVTAAVKSESAPGTAIALIDRKTEVDQWVRDKYKLRAARNNNSSGKYDHSARAAGHAAADSTDISGGRGKNLGAGRKALPSG